MRAHCLTFLMTALTMAAFAAGVRAQPDPEFLDDRRKLGQTGMQFLTVSVDARSAALADAVTAQEASSSAMFYNPAAMASMPTRLHAALGRNSWISGIDYNFGTVAFRPGNGGMGTVGVSVLAVSYGELYETVRADNEKGFEELGTYSPSAMVVGLGYARALTDRFAVGGNLKYVTQSLGSHAVSMGSGGLGRKDFSQGAMAVDFGIIYQTGFRSLNFAMDVRNFSREMTYAEESFELPLTYQVGVSMNMLDLTALDPATHALTLSVDATHPRSYVEQVKVGMEYSFLSTLALRAGYTYPTDEQGINLGFGLQQGIGGMGVGIDYAYSQFGTFGNVHRLGVDFSIE